MPFINKVLAPPTYGWQDDNGQLIRPTPRQIIKEFFHRINIFRIRKNWLALTSWIWTLSLLPFLLLFIFKYFTWWLVPVGFVYSMVCMGSHGTIWYHRYATHRAYQFSNRFWQFFTQNLVIKAVSEELYVVSHHVHHLLSDKPGDPYNAQAGFLYCFLADVNHQPISTDLDKADYRKATKFLIKAGVRINSYTQYKRWGSVSHPLWTWLHLVLNWTFWYTIFFFIGGHALACALFGSAFVWAIGIRTFNYEGHGKGEDKRKEGLDFGDDDLSINQYWPGYVAGEWHNNHHVFPRSARNGFTPSQLDLPWYYIRLLYAIGGVSRYNDATEEFYSKYYEPYLESKSVKQMGESAMAK